MDDVAGEAPVVEALPDLPRKNSEEMVITMFGGDRIHVLSVVAPGVGVGGDFLAEFRFEKALGFPELAVKELAIGVFSLPRVMLDCPGKGIMGDEEMVYGSTQAWKVGPQ